MQKPVMMTDDDGGDGHSFLGSLTLFAVIPLYHCQHNRAIATFTTGTTPVVVTFIDAVIADRRDNLHRH